MLWTSRLGDTADGMTDGIMETGTAHIIMEASTADGMTLGTGEAIGDGTTRGTIHITVHTTADGMEDGILTGDITITTITDTARDISEALITIRMYGTAQDIRLDPSAYSEAVHHSEAESAAEAL